MEVTFMTERQKDLGFEGLTSEQARTLQEEYGKNELNDQKKESFWRKAFGIICEPMFLLLIAAAVIYNRHRRMIFFEYPRHGIRIMSRGNEIEIMRALFNEPVKSAHNIFVAHRDARSPAAYLAVLAIHAPEIAPAEEHCA